MGAGTGDGVDLGVIATQLCQRVRSAMGPGVPRLTFGWTHPVDEMVENRLDQRPVHIGQLAAC